MEDKRWFVRVCGEHRGFKVTCVIRCTTAAECKQIEDHVRREGVWEETKSRKRTTRLLPENIRKIERLHHDEDGRIIQAKKR